MASCEGLQFCPCLAATGAESIDALHSLCTRAASHASTEELKVSGLPCASCVQGDACVAKRRARTQIHEQALVAYGVQFARRERDLSVNDTVHHADHHGAVALDAAVRQ
jgi:hypothetical protein